MKRHITVLVPAHNEGTPRRRTLRRRKGLGQAPLREGLDGLNAQTHSVGRVVLIADNCTDDTVDVAVRAGVEVFTTRDNTDKKAGALNQWLDQHLSTMGPEELVLVVDADSVLEPDFVANAVTYVEQGYDAVGGVFSASPAAAWSACTNATSMRGTRGT